MYLHTHTCIAPFKVQYHRPEIIRSQNPCRNNLDGRNGWCWEQFNNVLLELQLKKKKKRLHM